MTAEEQARELASWCEDEGNVFGGGGYDWDYFQVEECERRILAALRAAEDRGREAAEQDAATHINDAAWGVGREAGLQGSFLNGFSAGMEAAAQIAERHFTDPTRRIAGEQIAARLREAPKRSKQ